MKTLLGLLCVIVLAVVNCEVEEKDLYGTLGISRDASQREIKKAFRKLSRKYHPDKNIGDEEAAAKFSSIAEVQLNILLIVVPDTSKHFLTLPQKIQTFHYEGIRNLVGSRTEISVR